MNKDIRPFGFVSKMAGGFFVVWIIYAILSLVAMAAGLYVAFHFIMKYW